MDSAASAILNSLKHLAKITDNIHLISPSVLTPMLDLKEKLGYESPILTVEEVLYALSISAATNPTAGLALTMLDRLKNAQAHSTTLLNSKDEQIFTRLEIDVTCDPVFASDKLYY